MDANAFEEHLKKKDDETRPARVKRWAELSPDSYKELPRFLWDYSGDAVDLWIDGHFTSVILWCAAMMEVLLSDQLIAQGITTRKEAEAMSLDAKRKLCCKFGLLTAPDEENINAIRELRNSLVHANAGKLAEMAKAHYGQEDETLQGVLPELYLGNFGGEMASKALESLKFTRGLINRWYGADAES